MFGKLEDGLESDKFLTSSTALQHNVGLGGAVVVTIYKKANNAKVAPHVGYNAVSYAQLLIKVS